MGAAFAAVLVGFELDAPGDKVRASVSLLVLPVERIYRVHERLVDLEYRVPHPAIVLPVVLQAQDVEDLVERERYPSVLRDPPLRTQGLGTRTAVVDEWWDGRRR